MSFTIAIVGRPNVGKSTLFNRLVGKRLALVDDRPGVTRDRREGMGRLGDLVFTIVDTAGFEESAPETLSGRMRSQTEAAVALADAILLVVDAREGLTPVDRAFANLLRRSGKCVILVANKAEGRAGEAGALEAYALGFGEPVSISAEHGEGLADLYEALRAALPQETAADEDDDQLDDKPEREVPQGPLINRLIGEDRLLTGPEAGITRDAIAVELTWHDRQFRLFDTAGMRRKAKVEEKLEKLSVADALNAIRFAEVVVLLMDAEKPFEDQDMRIADLVEREGRAFVIGMNKWDLVAKRGAAGKLREQADHWLPQVKGVPIAAVSGLTGDGLDRLMQAVVDAHVVWNRRITTNRLNRWLGQATSEHPPPAVAGRTLKLNYITQPKARPPSFVLFCTRADKVPEAYKRYLVNGLRETFDLPGTPIRLTLREKVNPYAGRK
jgi:GTPase